MNKFKVGDMVNMSFFNFCGKVISIEQASDKIKELTEIDDDFILYKIEISSGVFMTTNEESLELIVPGRSSDIEKY